MSEEQAETSGRDPATIRLREPVRPSALNADRTLASRLAREIENDIMCRGWPLGESLGSEARLMARYGVGRSVLREAVRILESHAVVRPRPGPGGGLVVTAPVPATVSDATAICLDFAEVRPAHLFQAWSALEVVAVRELAGMIDTDGIASLRAIVEAENAVDAGREGPAPRAHTALHLEIARLTRNPALELFIGVLVDLVYARTPPMAGVVERDLQHTIHLEIVDAVISGDPALAQFHVRRCIQLREKAGSASGLPGDPG